jgi:hypothetical protein
MEVSGQAPARLWETAFNAQPTVSWLGCGAGVDRTFGCKNFVSTGNGILIHRCAS